MDGDRLFGAAAGEEVNFQQQGFPRVGEGGHTAHLFQQAGDGGGGVVVVGAGNGIDFVFHMDLRER